MKRLLLVIAALALAGSAHAQRRFRAGPLISTIAIDEGGGTANFTSFGGTFALLSGQDAETGVTVARYADLSTGSCERSLTFFGLDSYYYPVGAGGLAPFASTQLGLARLRESQGLLCPGTIETRSEIAFGFGLGVRVALGSRVAALVEGRFFNVLPDVLQGLEARGSVTAAFGNPLPGDLLDGTLGPAVSVWIPASGSLEGRGPFLGVRFRRDTRKSGTLGLQLDYAPLKITSGCSANCEPYGILFAPGYEASLHPRWGRIYGVIGVLLAGFPSEGDYRGMAQGAHGGIGADVYAGTGAMVNVNARVVWLQRAVGLSMLGVQVGASVSPKLVHPRAARSP